MKFSEEEIKRFKNDPFVKMLMHIAGPEALDAAIAEAENEMSKKESVNEREEYVNPIMNKDEFFALIDDLEFVKTEEDKLGEIGINLTGNAMVQKLWNIVYDLLSYIFNDDVAEVMIDNIYNYSPDKESLWRAANE